MILMHGGIHAIDTEFSALTSSYNTLECPECGFELTENHIQKLRIALWETLGGNIIVNRDEDGKIQTERFLVKSKPVLKEVGKKGGK